MKYFPTLILISIVLVATFAFSGCISQTTSTIEPTEPQSGPITLTDGLGRSITLQQPAIRVLSLAPSNTEILFAIGAGSKIVGRDTFSNYPEQALELPDIGGGFGELNIEMVLTANPDLVLAADLTPPEQVQALEQVGLTVYSLPNPTNFDGLYANIATVSQLVGNKDQGRQLIEDLTARVKAVEEKTSAAPEIPLTFYELDATDPNAPWTSGPGTFIDTLITMAGGENLGAELAGDWVQISIEELLSRDPDIIILGDYTWGGVTPEDVAARPGWETLSAIQNGKIYTIDDNLVSRPGPRMVDGLETMAKLIHPELFE
jgi:iron complex transport system substrate-binding protein